MKKYLRVNKKDQAKIRALADQVGVKRIYLTQIGSGFRRPSAVLARRIHDATDGEVHMCELRPDIFPPEVFQIAS